MEFPVPLMGGTYHIITQLAIYKWYILPIGGLYGTYHLLREPETTIEVCQVFFQGAPVKWFVIHPDLPSIDFQESTTILKNCSFCLDDNEALQ